MSRPREGFAGPNDTGRSCPYCRFPLKEQDEITTCGVCGSAHHRDCWNDNQGCAVVACAGGPGGTAHQVPIPAPPSQPSMPPPPPGEVDQSNNAAYLDPSGVRVAILGEDRKSNVATVQLTGIGYDGPGADNAGCNGYFDGVTWVKFEAGRWVYQGGYAVDDDRYARWKPRVDETLGYVCLNG